PDELARRCPDLTERIAVGLDRDADLLAVAVAAGGVDVDIANTRNLLEAPLQVERHLLDALERIAKDPDSPASPPHAAGAVVVALALGWGDIDALGPADQHRALGEFIRDDIRHLGPTTGR